MRKNLHRIYALNFAWSFLLVQAVIVPYFQSRGLTMAQVFTVQASFAATLCVLDIPTGYLADILGRRRLLIGASVCKGIGGVVLACSRGMGGMILSYCLIGVANSLLSGTDTALLYETREALPEEERPAPARMFGTRLSLALISVTASALVGGVLASRSLEIAVVCNAVFAWVPLFIALGVRDAPRRPVARGGHLARLGRAFRSILGEGRSLRLLAFTSMLYVAAPVISVFAFQGYWRASGLPAVAFGVLMAAYNLIGALSARLAHRLERAIGQARYCLLLGVLPVIGFLGAALAPPRIGVAFGLSLEICRGLGGAFFAEHLNAQIRTESRATTNSIVSLGGRLPVMLLGPAVGALADRAGFGAALFCLGALYAAFFLVTCVPLARVRRLAAMEVVHVQ